MDCLRPKVDRYVLSESDAIKSQKEFEFSTDSRLSELFDLLNTFNIREVVVNDVYEMVRNEVK